MTSITEMKVIAFINAVNDLTQTNPQISKVDALLQTCANSDFNYSLGSDDQKRIIELYFNPGDFHKSDTRQVTPFSFKPVPRVTASPVDSKAEKAGPRPEEPQEDKRQDKNPAPVELPKIEAPEPVKPKLGACDRFGIPAWIRLVLVMAIVGASVPILIRRAAFNISSKAQLIQRKSFMAEDIVNRVEDLIRTKKVLETESQKLIGHMDKNELCRDTPSQLTQAPDLIKTQAKFEIEIKTWKTNLETSELCKGTLRAGCETILRNIKQGQETVKAQAEADLSSRRQVESRAVCSDMWQNTSVQLTSVTADINIICCNISMAYRCPLKGTFVGLFRPPIRRDDEIVSPMLGDVLRDSNQTNCTIRVRHCLSICSTLELFIGTLGLTDIEPFVLDIFLTFACVVTYILAFTVHTKELIPSIKVPLILEAVVSLSLYLFWLLLVYFSYPQNAFIQQAGQPTPDPLTLSISEVIVSLLYKQIYIGSGWM
jgi:hypothetical protein